MRWRVGRLFVGVIAGVGLLTAGISHASSTEQIHLQALISPDGKGRLLANTGAGPWSWEACFSGETTCIPIAKGRELRVNGLPSGTRFRVVSGDRASGMSPEWLGRLKQVNPPSIGVAPIGQFVSPRPATWTGGWKGEYSELQLAACATADRRSCTTLTDPRYLRNCAASASFAIDPRFAGEYLRVADRRIGTGPPLRPAVGLTSPYGAEVWKASRSTAINIVGQIAQTLVSTVSECGPPPVPTASIPARGVGRIECRAGCRATLIARVGSRTARVERRILEQDALTFVAPIELRITPQDLLRLGQGPVEMVVTGDGQPLSRKVFRSLHS